MFVYLNLTDEVRGYMEYELKKDIEKGDLYLSGRLTAEGKGLYPNLLSDALLRGNEKTFADSLEEYMEIQEMRNYKNGPKLVAVPKGANFLLAEGEFTRFYIRGLCRFALKNNVPFLEVYRAKQSANPRRESETKIGTHVNPGNLLKDLTENVGIDTALGLPNGPNSGLCVKLI